jgi:hypothetical protein
VAPGATISIINAPINNLIRMTLFSFLAGRRRATGGAHRNTRPTPK